MAKILTTKDVEKSEDLFVQGLPVSRSQNYLHQGMRGTRKANLSFSFTNLEMLEYIKCYNDPIYFIEQYCKMQTPDGIRPIALYESQKESIRIYQEHKCIIYLSAIQSGTDLVSSLLFLHQMTFIDDFSVICNAYKSHNNLNIIKNIQISYVLLPFFLKRGLINFSMTNITFDNGSFISAASKEYSAPSVRYMTDFSHFANQEELFVSIYPVVCARQSDKLIIASVPNGDNFFKTLVDSSKFTIQRIKWNDIPGRGELWKEEQIRMIGKKRFDQDYNLEFLK
jgi:hypothetical protein